MSIDSSMKLLDYINKVALEPIVLDGDEFGTPPPVEVRLNDSFFFKDGCQMCGKCCPCETNAWTREGMCRIQEAKPEDFTKWGLSIEVLGELETLVQREEHDINGKTVVFFSIPKPKKGEYLTVEWPDRAAQPRCRWLFEKDGTYRCLIHPVRSVTCGMPHCRFHFAQATRTTSIGLSQFGRNWALRCPVKFEEYVDEESVQSRILWLKRLNATAEDCGVRTWLPDVIRYLEAGNRRPHRFLSLSPHKLF